MKELVIDLNEFVVDKLKVYIIHLLGLKYILPTNTLTRSCAFKTQHLFAPNKFNNPSLTTFIYYGAYK